MYKKLPPVKDEKLLKSMRTNVSEGHYVACEMCGSTYGTVPHHVVRRSFLRLDIRNNLVKLCVNCHNDFHSLPKDKFISRHGAAWYEKLTSGDQVLKDYKGGLNE